MYHRPFLWVPDEAVHMTSFFREKARTPLPTTNITTSIDPDKLSTFLLNCNDISRNRAFSLHNISLLTSINYDMLQA